MVPGSVGAAGLSSQETQGCTKPSQFPPLHLLKKQLIIIIIIKNSLCIKHNPVFHNRTPSPWPEVQVNGLWSFMSQQWESGHSAHPHSVAAAADRRS